MKIKILLFAFMLSAIASIAQSSKEVTESHLGISRSNYYRLVYPEKFMSADQAKRMLTELEKTPLDAEQLKTWLPANFKQYGLKKDDIKQISVYGYTEYADCKECEANCKGKCVQDADGICVCVSTEAPEKMDNRPVRVILLLDKEIGDDGSIDLIVKSYKRTTAVKTPMSD